MPKIIATCCVIVCLLSCVCSTWANPSPAIPDDFPRFTVPGHEKAMVSLRELFYLHYPRAGPLATLWDEWMSISSLWPAVESKNKMHSNRKRWADVLSNRHIDPEGYVATHQHVSIAHQQGWPFPFWAQGGPGTWGWHFSLNGISPHWHATQEKTQQGWELIGAVDKGIADRAWNIELTSARASARTPPLIIDPFQSPFIQLRWRAEGIDNTQPYLEWTTKTAPQFGPDRRFYFQPVTKPQGVVYTMIPVYKSPAWKGKITRLAINFDNPANTAKVGIQALFTQYDTRHTINNPCYIRGCCQYFWWTRDLNFLRRNIQRMRLALQYMMDELGGRREKCILVPWVGHDGRSGHEIGPDGKRVIHSGRGIGNNYWDLLPMGYKDVYATIHYYDTLNYMADLEREILQHPQWNIPAGPLRIRPKELRRHAQEVKGHAGKMFWNDKTGRFVCSIDIDGKSYDYGLTFLNLDAIYYDFATGAQADSIVKWIAGRRIVAGDTSQGKDIYHWRFAPRATTKRNVEYYLWSWRDPGSIPWGYQVQDGGAVLGFSYHDLASRLKVLGPDDAWRRLQAIISWFDEVQAAGGYREYYKDPKRGSLQGGGTPGGLGLDHEFFESVLVPQVMFYGFLGFKPRADGFEINPRLPADWPKLGITRIAFQQLILDITATADTITVVGKGRRYDPMFVYVPAGKWQVSYLDSAGKAIEQYYARTKAPAEPIQIRIEKGKTLKLVRQ